MDPRNFLFRRVAQVLRILYARVNQECREKVCRNGHPYSRKEIDQTQFVQDLFQRKQIILR